MKTNGGFLQIGINEMKIEDFVKNEELKEIIFARRKGNAFTYVLQYPPQVRSIMVIGRSVPVHVQQQTCFGKRMRRRGMPIAFQAIVGAFGSFLGQEHIQEWRREPDTAYRLAFPYLIFVINFKKRKYDKTVVAVRNEPLKSINDPLYRLPLSNIYRFPDGLGLCMDFHSDEMNENWGIKKKLKTVVDGFWFTKFGGTSPYIRQTVDRRVINYFVWLENTKNDPSFATTVKWNNPGWTVKDVVDIIGEQYHGINYRTEFDSSKDYRQREFEFGDDDTEDEIELRLDNIAVDEIDINDVAKGEIDRGKFGSLA